MNQRIVERSEKVGYPYRLFGWFETISNPFFYLIWINVDRHGYGGFVVRAIISLLAIPLVLKNHWPKKLFKFFPLYWYITLTYSLPFFFTFMLLKNSFSYSWVLNTLTGVVLSILLLDTLSLMIVFPVGIFTGWLLYHITTPEPAVLVNVNYVSIIISYSAVILFGALFARGREKFHEEKEQTLRSIGASMAHELRTPLRAISAGLGGIRNYLSQLMEGYQSAKQANLSVPYINPVDYKSLPAVFDSIESEARAAFNVIDMLLVKANLSSIVSTEFKPCSIKHCVEEALRRYAFKRGEKELVHWVPDNFEFNGDQLLVVHVLFNLLKNAIHYIKAAGKGEITIEIGRRRELNILRFRDTGQGVASDVLPHIFDRFFTRTMHGTGVGLAYCKMVMQSLGGDITCDSKEGEYTEFTLFFPIMSRKTL